MSAADLLNYWYGDRATSVILLHTEGYGDPRRFARIARRTSARLPIVAVRPLLPGADEAAAVAFEQRAGVIRVRTVRELIDTGRVFADQPRPRGGRAGIVTNTRAGAALATSAMRGADLVSAGVHDLGPNADAAAYADAVSAVVDDDGVDIVVVIYAPPLAPDSHVVEAIELVSRRHREARGGAAKPIVAVALGAGDGPLVRGGTVPAFRFPEHAIDALAAARRHRVHAGELPIADGENEAAIDRERLGAMRAAATRLVSLDERAVAASRDYVDVAALLRAAGLRVIAAIPVATLDEALAAGARAGFPVALKVAGMKRPGRSEAGGIALDLHDAEALRGAYERMDNRLGPAMAHAVVQAMAPPGVDVRVVIENHVDYGPMVSFGLGGLYADVIGDGPCRAVPLTAADRRDLVAESRASVALAQAHLALDAVDEVIAAASALGEHVWELDRLVMNPILVSAAGAFVLDAEATVTSRPEPQRDYVRHL